MKITKIFILFTFFNLFLMIWSLAYNSAILHIILMVMYISILVTLGSYIAEKFIKIKVLDKANTIQFENLLLYSTLIALCTFILKIFIGWSDIDFTTYTTIRTSFFLKPYGIIGLLFEVFMWLSLIAAGVCFTNIKSKKTLVLIMLSILMALFLTGSRSSILLFFMAYLASLNSVKDFFNRHLKYIGIIFILFIILSYIRGVSLDHLIIPWDSFIVGPHLFHENFNTIVNQTKYLHDISDVPIGYALFSGFYVSMNTLLSYFNIDVFKYHLEAIFWERHLFTYIQALNENYNSYYTAGLAIVVEGWIKVGILSFIIGMLPHLFTNHINRIVSLSIVYLFAFSLFQNSIFHNTAMTIILVTIILIELIKVIFYLMRVTYARIK